MTLVVAGVDRGPAVALLEPTLPDRDGALDELIERVQQSGLRLVDAWHAAAVIESLGYTDLRSQRELGFSDTRAAGEYVFQVAGDWTADGEGWVPPRSDPPFTIVARSAASTLIYAVPWLALFIARLASPDALRMPSAVASALALALMFSLIASGGFVQAIVRRGEFYVGLRQARLAWAVMRTLLQAGIAVSVAVAAAGAVVGWYFQLFAWPSLVLGADAFVIMAALWMVCGIFSIRQQHWRVAIAFVAGFGAFSVARACGAQVVTSELIAAAAVLSTAWLQARWLFRDREPAAPARTNVTMPRLEVLAYCMLPYFWYGTVYFAFLFADRLAAGTAVVALLGGPFGTPEAYSLGMEMALLTLLLAASGVEVAGALFARAFSREAVHPIAGGVASLRRTLNGHHQRAIGFVVVSFAAIAIGVAAAAAWLLPSGLPPAAALTLAAGDAGYGLLAIGLLNALVLFETRRPWTVVSEFTAAFVINLASGYLLSHALGSAHAVDGLLLGAGYLAVASSIAVRRTLTHPDYVYAAG